MLCGFLFNVNGLLSIAVGVEPTTTNVLVFSSLVFGQDIAFLIEQRGFALRVSLS